MCILKPVTLSFLFTTGINNSYTYYWLLMLWIILEFNLIHNCNQFYWVCDKAHYLCVKIMHYKKKQRSNLMFFLCVSKLQNNRLVNEKNYKWRIPRNFLTYSTMSGDRWAHSVCNRWLSVAGKQLNVDVGGSSLDITCFFIISSGIYSIIFERIDKVTSFLKSAFMC